MTTKIILPEFTEEALETLLEESGPMLTDKNKDMLRKVFKEAMKKKNVRKYEGV